MIVIPMAGASKRFLDAGYNRPKYMLPLWGETVFTHAVSSFRNYFDTEKFLFIAKDALSDVVFIEEECRKLGIKDFYTVIIDKATRGQAETVAIGLQRAEIADNDPLTIFNIDTFRNGFRFPDADWMLGSHGYLEVFVGSGANWSYVLPMEKSSRNRVIKTSEKEPISNLCSNGLYHFSRTSDFLTAVELELANMSYSELYVAPLYNHLIRMGKVINYLIVKEEEIVFCGVPNEYEALLAV